MANTTNFGWETPDDTDLVKDGAAAMRTLGNAIDASFVDLKGGTTGQILSKNSNTDLDYTWINNDQGDITEVQGGTGISVASGTGPIPVITNTVATEFDAKADLIVGTGSDAFDRLGVGANGTVLTADSSVSPTGLKWALPSAGLDLIKTVTATGVSSINIGSDADPLFSSTYDNYRILFQTTAAASISMRLRANTTDASGSDYRYQLGIAAASTATAGSATSQTSFTIAGNVSGSVQMNAWADMFSPFIAEPTTLMHQMIHFNSDTQWIGSQRHSLSTSYNGISFIAASGNFTDAKISIYGYRK